MKRFNWILVGKIVLGALYFLAAGEIFMRLFAPQPMLPRYVCATSYGIRGNTPNQNYWHKASEYRINIRTNSKGLRADREIPYEKPPGMRRILLLGDSFGIGYGVNLEDMFLSRLVASLNAAGVRCEGVNLSVSGHGTAEELVALQEEGFRYEPDLVIIAWHSTDLEDNTRSNLYALEDGRLVRKSKTYLPAVKTRELLFRFAGYRWLAGNSHLYCCVRERTAYFVKWTLMPVRRELTQIRRPAPPSGQEQPKPRHDSLGELAVALLAEIQRQCHQRGAELLILDIPSRSGRTKFYPTFPTDHMSEQTRFHIYSPIADFKQHYGEKLYWEKAHGHFTPLGCRIVGEGLARMVLERGLLEPDFGKAEAGTGRKNRRDRTVASGSGIGFSRTELAGIQMGAVLEYRTQVGKAFCCVAEASLGTDDHEAGKTQGRREECVRADGLMGRNI